MPTSAKGSTLSYATGSSPASRTIGYILNISEVAKTMEHLDTMDLDSSAPSYVPSGITNYEPITVQMLHVVATAQTAMEAKIGSTTTTTFTLTLAGSPQKQYTIVGYVNQFSRGPLAVNSVVEASMTILPTSIT